MLLKKFSTLVLIVLLVSTTSCRTNPVKEINNAAISVTKTATMKDVKSAITKAGLSLGWGMKPVKPGVIIGTIYVREHMAKVKITYNLKNFSILYKDSANLKYDGASIHKNYNSWVVNLERRINSHLTSL